MKHLKTYKLFESSEKGEIESYLKDIFLEAQDMGLPIKIESMNGLIQGIFKYMKEPLLWRITIGDNDRKPDATPFKLADVYDSILMARSYMSEEGEINKVFKTTGYHISKIKVKGASLFSDLPDNYILNNILSYEKGEGELYNKPIVSIQIDFKRN